MTCKCEHPVLIFNPNLEYLFSVVCHRACLGGNMIEYNPHHKRYYDFPWHFFYAAKSVVTEKNQDNYYLIDDDGVVYPVFKFVPCGKCKLCRSRAIDDWQTRCMCESATSSYAPYFFTLTFRPDCRPTNMDDAKVEFQKFMKRLRIKISRDLGIANRELRYIVVSEYTPKNHYIHFHGLLWNMPYIAATEGQANSFQALIQFFSDAWSNGFVKLEKCRDCSGAYALKYLRKGDDPDCFMLASRRNGIGYKFAMSLLPVITRNPDMTTFSVKVDKQNRGVVTSSVVRKRFPVYFKRLLWPTVSVLFPAKVSKAVKDFHRSATELSYYLRLRHDRHHLVSELSDMVSYVADKYPLHPVDYDDAKPSRKFRKNVSAYISAATSDGQYHDSVDARREIVVFDPLKGCRLVWLTPTSSDILQTPIVYRYEFRQWLAEFRQYLISLLSTVRQSFSVLSAYEYDEAYFRARLDITKQHQDYLMTLDLPDVNVQDLVDVYDREQRWIETNWVHDYDAA